MYFCWEIVLGWIVWCILHQNYLPKNPDVALGVTHIPQLFLRHVLRVFTSSTTVEACSSGAAALKHEALDSC